MAEFPSYVKVIAEGYMENFDPSVEVTEMERGFARQRVKNTFVTMKLTIRILMEGRDNIAAFDSWYFDTIKRIGFFTMRHPRTKETITCRFLEGKLGDLEPLGPDFSLAARTCTVEYIRI